MDLSEPDTLFFHDCINHILSVDGPRYPDSNIAVLGGIDDNRELVSDYVKWFEMYFSIMLAVKNTDGFKELIPSTDSTKSRLADVVISFRNAESKRASL